MGKRCAIFGMLFFCVTSVFAAITPLPQGNTGIASQFPGDANIRAHPDVVWSDDFESYSSADDLWDNYSNLFQVEHIRFATEPENRYAGSKGLEFRIPFQQDEESNAIVKAISPTQDKLFVRVYTKFSPGFYVSGSGHNGISMSASYWDGPGSGPGEPADGENKFMVNVENSMELGDDTPPGNTNSYVYHPEQRSQWGDHWYPDGIVMPWTSTPGEFGPDFVERPNFVPELNRWYCYELMVQANTPGQRDGRVAVWIDGALIADWQNIRLRDVSTLKIDTIDIGLHKNSDTVGENKKWYDNLVVAKSYIGPMENTGNDSNTSNDSCGDGTCNTGETCTNCPQDCIQCTDADNNPCDGCIEIIELDDSIEQWLVGNKSMSIIMDTIRLWKAGCLA